MDLSNDPERVVYFQKKGVPKFVDQAVRALSAASPADPVRFLRGWVRQYPTLQEHEATAERFCAERHVGDVLDKLVTALYMHMPEDPIAFAGRWLEEYVPDYDPKRMGQETYRLLPGHNMFWCGAFDPGLRVFDVVMETALGTSYNAYLLKGMRYNVLFETVKSTTTGARKPLDDTFWAQMLWRLQSCLAGQPLHYIVCNHTEPDHSGSATRLIQEVYPDCTLVGTPAAIGNVEEIGNWTGFKRLPIDKDDIHLDVGGYTLKFIVAPFLHWPDSMFTWIPEMGTLVTCDVFGAHLCDPRVFDDGLTARDEELYIESMKYYFDCIFGPFKSWMRQALDKIKDLPIQTIACSHGYVIRNRVELFKRLYAKWAAEEPLAHEVVIPYVSAYGYTQEMAQFVAQGVEQQGVTATLLNLVEVDLPAAKAALHRAKGVLFGVPTLVADAPEPIWELALSLNSYTCKDQYAGCFGSYGWSGEGTENIDQRLQQVRIKLPLDPLKFKFRASEADRAKCVEFGAKFARAVKGEAINERSVGKTGAKPQRSKPVLFTDGRVRKWKCIVCGEIVISKQNPEICGACGADGDAFVCIGIVGEVFAPQASFEGTIVIVGGSAAGVMAARTIREVNRKCRVILLSQEAQMPYYRPSLSHTIANPEVIQDPGFWICKPKWYAENNVELRLRSKVVSVDKAAKTLIVEDGEQGKTYREHWDRLILACGSTNFNPFPATNYPNVFGLRSFEDCRHIMEYIRDHEEVKQVVVLGAGLLGIECAESLLHLNVAVNMIDLAPRILPMQLSQGASDIYEKFLNECGIKTFLGKAPKAFEADGQQATGVLLDGGAVVEGQMIIFAIGVRANTQLGVQLGLRLGGRGIDVDRRMETSAKDIFACGDCAEHEGRWIPNWSNAISQGKTAGEAAAGVADPVFEKPVAPYTLKAFGLTVYSVGTIPKDASGMTLIQKDPENVTYTKLYFAEGETLTGAVSLAPDQSMVVPLNNAVTNAIPFRDAFDLLSNKPASRPIGWQRQRRMTTLGQDLPQRGTWMRLLKESESSENANPMAWAQIAKDIPTFRRGSTIILT